MTTRPPTRQGQSAYPVCRCGHWETDHEAQTGVCRICPQSHRYEFYEFRYALVSDLEAPVNQEPEP